MRSLFKKSGSLLLCFIWLIWLTACRKPLPEINPYDYYPEQTFTEVFDVYWTGMNHNYVFWDIDPTDWDTVYLKYRPLFAQLQRSKEQDTKKAYAYFKEISANLIDTHYRLDFTSVWLENEPAIRPGDNRLAKRPDYHDRIPDNYFSGKLPKAYLDKGSTYAISGDQEFFIVLGTIQQNIGYYHSDACEMASYYYSTDPDDAKIKKQITAVLQMLKQNNLKGLILDLRANYGGNANELNFLLGRITAKPYSYGSTRSKSGLGRFDFGPWMTEKISPLEGAKSLNIPIVVLTDMWSISCAEIITAALKVRPEGKVTVVGERTYGATGPLVGFPVHNAGQFSSNFFSLVKTSSMSFRYQDGKSYESIGFSPDIPLKTDLSALASGKDPQLEKAISIIKGQ